MKEQVPNTWEERTKVWWNSYLAQTDYQAYQPLYSNGFMGFGILKTREDHGEHKGVNQIVFMWYLTFESAPDSFNRVAVTEDEAKNMSKNLSDVLGFCKV